MQKTGEDKNYVYFMDHFQDTPVQVMQDEKTGEIFFNADDIVKILGLGDNIKEFLGTDKGLDFINDFKRDHPGVWEQGNDQGSDKGLTRASPHQHFQGDTMVRIARTTTRGNKKITARLRQGCHQNGIRLGQG